MNREGGGGWRATAAGDQASLSSDKNALKSDSGDGRTPLKTTELYTLQEGILRHVNCISIKLL